MAKAQEITGVQDRRNAGKLRTKVAERLHLKSGNVDGTYVQSRVDTAKDTPTFDSDTHPKYTPKCPETEDLGGSQYTPPGHTSESEEYTLNDTATGGESKTDGAFLGPANLHPVKGGQKNECVRIAGPSAPCGATPSASETASKAELRPAQDISPVSLEVSLPVDPLEDFLADIPEVTDIQPVSEPATRLEQKPPVPAPGSVAEAAALSLLALYNQIASPAFPGAFPAVDPGTHDARYCLGRISCLLEASPGLQEDLEALVQALPYDDFYRGEGNSDKGHRWDFRYIAMQKASRLKKQGARAQKLLDDQAKSNLVKSPQEPSTRRPAHRREADNRNAQQMLAAYKG